MFLICKMFHHPKADFLRNSFEEERSEFTNPSLFMSIELFFLLVFAECLSSPLFNNINMNMFNKEKKMNVVCLIAYIKFSL